MDNSDFNNITFTGSTNNYYSQLTTGSVTTTMNLTGSNVEIVSDKDWMPYTHFEYDPLWHKKFAAIKYQMQTMWN